MGWLKNMFVKYFNVENMTSELMDLIDDDKLMDFILSEFKNNFTRDELYEELKDELSEEDLETFLSEDLGYGEKDELMGKNENEVK